MTISNLCGKILRPLLVTLATCASAAALGDQPMRIVSAGGSVTEVIYALGQGDKVVATDSTSLFPQAAAETVKLGYFRQLSAEGVLAQQPTHLIGASATGPGSALEQISNGGVKVTLLGEERNLNGLMHIIEELGQHLQAKAQAEALKARIQMAVAEQQAIAEHHHLQGLKGLYVVAHNDRGLTVAGAQTVPDALFATLGITNVAGDLEHYKLMDNEALIQANPDFVLLANHSVHSDDAKQALCEHPALRTSAAGEQCLIATLPSSISLGLSPRFAEALAQINRIAAQAAQSKASTASLRP